MLFRDRMRAVAGECRLLGLWVLGGMCRFRAARAFYRAMLARLVDATGLFDRAGYLEANGDVAEQGINPLMHYVAYGDREGREPMALFNPGHYRAHARGFTKRVNALLHYAWVGRYRRICTGPWFDTEYYLANNKDVARAGCDPLFHFVNWGGLEGRSPCPSFDSEYYLRTYPDVAEARVNPLVHYLRFGRLEGREPAPVSHDLSCFAWEPLQVETPDLASWHVPALPSSGADAQVDVVVPVYAGRTETLRCLHSVLSAKNRTPYELIVINDKSPDDELSANLRELAQRGLFTLLENDVNRGFVGTVNRGMQCHTDRDVVLLNSDTEVYEGWLDRLRDTACSDAAIATVTPLSNNATICSYPNFLQDNPYPLEIPYAQLDALAAQANAGETVEAPTGVGFCLYIKRTCLDDVGLFDEATFGKGYGEENDFCQRAIAKGWRHVIAADVFVRHWGAASFKGEKAKRVQDAMVIMENRYPAYKRDVAEFISRDPLAAARRNLDRVRVERLSKAENVLIVCHNRGGGAVRHVQEQCEQLLDAGCGVFMLRPWQHDKKKVMISHPKVPHLPNCSPIEFADTDALARALAPLRITRIHSHGLIDFARDAPRHLVALAKALDVALDATIHDYKVICPRLNLADERGVYCGEPGEATCNRCLKQHGSPFGVTDIRAWRALHREALANVNRVITPDEDVTRRLRRYFPERAFDVRPHESTDFAGIKARKPVIEPGKALRVAVIGAIGKIKGYDVVRGCAADAVKRRLPIEFQILGFTMDDRPLTELGVTITGKYSEPEARGLLAELAPDFVWLPALWPETYSYTLSLGMEAGIPVVAFDIGAIAARLRRAGKADHVLPLALAERYGEINDYLLRSAMPASEPVPAVAQYGTRLASADA